MNSPRAYEEETRFQKAGEVLEVSTQTTLYSRERFLLTVKLELRELEWPIQGQQQSPDLKIGLSDSEQFYSYTTFLWPSLATELWLIWGFEKETISNARSSLLENREGINIQDT